MQKKVKLGDIADILPGHHFRGAIERTDEGMRVLQANAIDGERNTIDWNNLTVTHPAPVREDAELQEYDVVIVTRGTQVGSYRVAVVRDLPGAVYAASSVYIIRVTKPDVILPEYLAQYLRSPHAQKMIMQEATGAVILVVPRRKLADLTIPVPDMDTQKALAGLGDSIVRESELLTQKKELNNKLMRSIINNLARN
jgi:restriction endonuclease S subunit